MWTCKNCNTENKDEYPFCIECTASRDNPPVSENHCINPNCPAYNVPLENPTQKYCGYCTSMTSFMKKAEEAIGH